MDLELFEPFAFYSVLSATVPMGPLLTGVPSFPLPLLVTLNTLWPGLMDGPGALRAVPVPLHSIGYRLAGLLVMGNAVVSYSHIASTQGLEVAGMALMLST